MGGDISRSTFDPSMRYTGVRQQQGRVNLDADWNEQIDIAAHRLGTETRDLVGPSGGPRDAAGFGIDAPGAPAAFAINDLTISAGRFYVAGHLCELDSTLVPIENFTGDGTATAGTQVQLATAVLDGTALEPGQWVQISAQGDPAPTPQLAMITAVNAAAGSVTFAVSISSFESPNTSPQLQRVTTYLTQPDYPTPPALPTAGTAIVYLDVWERTITALDDPTIQEIALGGPDTTTRTKTVWQLKYCTVPSGVSCSTPGSAIAAWEMVTAPSSGLLTNGVVPSTSAGPCSISTGSGFTGMENQLYRVEIHQPGTLAAAAAGPLVYPLPAGTATFKWSRDNASVATGVTTITALASSAGVSTSQLTVQSTGRDAVLSFSPYDWIEITDDYLELGGLPGELHQIDSNGVDQTRATITLSTPVSAALLGRLTGPVNYHTRICRWDQGGQVLLAGTGTLWVDLNAAGSTGDIPVPPSGTSLILENSVTVSFGLSSATGLFNIADAWTFAARTADGSVEPLVQAPPSSIKHQYCRLGTISFDATPWAINDCRQLFPPMADPGVHVTSVFLTGATQGLLNDSSITVQQLATGISVSCDGALDPASVSQPNNTLIANRPPISSEQATCFVSVGLPIVSGTAIVGFQPLTLGAMVQLDTSQTTIQWVPAANVIDGLTALMTTVSTQLSPNGAAPALPTLMAHLTLKGNAIWALDDPDVYLDGETLGTPYLDTNNNQRTGLLLPSGDGRRGGDFSMWFWLTSQPTLTISPTSLSFLPTAIGTSSAPQIVTLTNTTANDIGLDIGITGGFTQTNTSTLSAAGVPTIPANSSCTFTITFSPIVNISFSSQLTIVGGGVTLEVELTGTGVDYVLGVSPTSIAFGGQQVNTTGAVQTVTLTNNGSLPISITGVTAASTNFVYSTTCASLAVGGTCSINVQFAPKVLGAITDSITISGPNPGLLIPAIRLSGTGTQPKNETKDINDAKSFRDTKIIRDKPRGMLEQIVRPVGVSPILLQTRTPAVAEEATGKAFIQPEERPAVGQQALEKPEEPK